MRQRRQLALWHGACCSAFKGKLGSDAGAKLKGHFSRGLEGCHDAMVAPDVTGCARTAGLFKDRCIDKAVQK
ncbi:MAG TPA: hypothetical protein VMB25_03730 [Bryobacteraceae bacterium]|nr:hypothetical protein [Bryobacteraceae bacterium]